MTCGRTASSRSVPAPLISRCRSAGGFMKTGSLSSGVASLDGDEADFVALDGFPSCIRLASSLGQNVRDAYHAIRPAFLTVRPSGTQLGPLPTHAKRGPQKVPDPVSCVPDPNDRRARAREMSFFFAQREASVSFACVNDFNAQSA